MTDKELSDILRELYGAVAEWGRAERAKRSADPRRPGWQEAVANHARASSRLLNIVDATARVAENFIDPREIR